MVDQEFQYMISIICMSQDHQKSIASHSNKTSKRSECESSSQMSREREPGVLLICSFFNDASRCSMVTL